MTRRAVIVAVVAVAVGAMVLFVAPTAGACTLPPGPGPTEEELLARADTVFEGVATSRSDPNADAPTQSSGDPIVWTFAVDRQIKGTVTEPQDVSSARSGATCGITFRIGTRYRVFADAVDGVLWASLGSGTREATLEPSTITTATTTVPPARPQRTTGSIALTG